MSSCNDKIKILLLGTTDNMSAGHVLSVYNSLPNDKFDKRLVIKLSYNGWTEYAFETCGSIKFKIKNKLECLYLYLKNTLLGRSFKLDLENSQYCFFTDDDKAVSANKILNKIKGFTPDVISLHYVGTFLSAQTVWDLYKKTNAHFIFNFTDEEFLGGGCHYHCDCNGYLNHCIDCPALVKGKEKAKRQLEQRRELWKDIPKTIRGVPYDIEKALLTSHFCNAHMIPRISCPKVVYTEKNVARKRFKLREDDFVIMLGAYSLNDKRKGFEFAIEGILKFCGKKGIENEKVRILLAGKESIDKSVFKNVCVIETGFLNKEDLFLAFCSSDLFLSSTIADSGPYMVNYAFALGTPVVSFDLGVAHSLIEDGKNGFLADYKKSESIATAITKYYMMTEEERNIIKKNALVKIRSFSNNSYAYEDFYEWWINR